MITRMVRNNYNSCYVYTIGQNFTIKLHVLYLLHQQKSVIPVYFEKMTGYEDFLYLHHTASILSVAFVSHTYK